MAVDVALVQPPIRDFYLTAKRTVPYGLARMAAVLQERGITVSLIDALACSRSKDKSPPAELSYLQPYLGRDDRSPFALFNRYRHYGRSVGWIEKRLHESSPRVIGISLLFSGYAADSLALARQIAQSFPESFMVLGGHHASAFPAQCLAETGADFVVRGEGELSFAALVQELLGHQKPLPQDPDLRRALAAIPGVCFVDHEGRFQHSAPAEVCALSELPLPASELIDWSYYRQRQGERQGARAVVVTSRGCRLHCSYCAVGAKSALSFRQRSAERVQAELQHAVVELGARFIDFEDENISWDRSRFMALLAALTPLHQRYGIECRAMNGLLPRTLDAENIAAMREAGFATLNLSLGSSSCSRLRVFRRPDERPFFERALACAEAEGMDAVGYVLAAAPGQMAEESLDDLFYLAARRVLIGLSIYYPAPGSHDFAELEARGLLGPSRTWRGAAFPIEDTTSRTQAVTLLRLARVLNFIKAELDQGRGLPALEPLRQQAMDPEQTLDRPAVGRRLLSAFLDDQRLRGVDGQGEIYAHLVDQTLCGDFVHRLERSALRGTR